MHRQYITIQAKHYFMYKYILLGTFALFVVACGNNNATKETANFSIEGDAIIVKEDSPILKQMVIQQTQLQDFSSEFQTVGTIRPVSGKFAEVAPPFAGQVTKSFVQLGQKVNAGSPVFELGSSEFYEAVKVYFAARSANELAQKNYNRKKGLSVDKLVSQRDLEEAQSEAEIAGQEFEQAKATLKIFNIDISSLQMGQPLRVVSPITGEVVKSNITIGAYAKEDSEPLAVIADLSRVWVAAQVKERYFGAIAKGDRAEVYTAAHPGKAIPGTIHYVGEMLDEDTRSLEVIVECDNAARELKLGMFCEVHFLGAPVMAIVLPSTAVMQERDSDYVLVETAKGRFVRRVVETESAGTDKVRIVSGLAEGENVVTQGGIFLNR